LSPAGLAHHRVIGVGRVAAKIEKLAALLGMQVRRVC
jgi:L-arabinose isomerase